MKILVIGAGPLGSLIAARLYQDGLNVSLLARGKRLKELKEHGVVLHSFLSKETESIHVPLVETFQSQDLFDLVMVVMRKNSAIKLLPTLKNNPRVPTFLFLMNNAAGSAGWIDALGKERVLIGFPGAAGYREGHQVVHLDGDKNAKGGIVMGEVEPGTNPQFAKIKTTLAKSEYLEVVEEPEMDAWLKYHTALLFPSLAPALYLCANDRLRFARTRDAILMAWRAIKEGFAVLQTLGYPIRPAKFRYFLWLPEPLVIAVVKKALKNPRLDVALVKHAEVIRDEIQQLNREFQRLIDKSGLFTPTIQFLTQQYDQIAPYLPDGSSNIRMRWSEVLIPILMLVIFVLLVFFVL